jgi:dUTP pyrophosphatase
MNYLLLVKLDDDLDENIKEYYKNYKLAHEGDAGIDLVCPSEQSMKVFDVEKINFKVKCAMVDQNGNLCSYYLYPRSSLSKHPLMLANHVGIIDSGYRGNLMAKVRCLPPSNDDIEKTFSHKIHSGDKLFQICSPTLGRIKLSVVDELPESDRGSGGFGSTGLNINV